MGSNFSQPKAKDPESLFPVHTRCSQALYNLGENYIYNVNQPPPPPEPGPRKRRITPIPHDTAPLGYEVVCKLVPLAADEENPSSKYAPFHTWNKGVIAVKQRVYMRSAREDNRVYFLTNRQQTQRPIESKTAEARIEDEELCRDQMQSVRRIDLARRFSTFVDGPSRVSISGRMGPRQKSMKNRSVKFFVDYSTVGIPPKEIWEDLESAPGGDGAFFDNIYPPLQEGDAVPRTPGSAASDRSVAELPSRRESVIIIGEGVPSQLQERIKQKEKELEILMELEEKQNRAVQEAMERNGSDVQDLTDELTQTRSKIAAVNEKLRQSQKLIWNLASKSAGKSMKGISLALEAITQSQSHPLSPRDHSGDVIRDPAPVSARLHSGRRSVVDFQTSTARLSESARSGAHELAHLEEIEARLAAVVDRASDDHNETEYEQGHQGGEEDSAHLVKELDNVRKRITELREKARQSVRVIEKLARRQSMGAPEVVVVGSGGGFSIEEADDRRSEGG